MVVWKICPNKISYHYFKLCLINLLLVDSLFADIDKMGQLQNGFDYDIFLLAILTLIS